MSTIINSFPIEGFKIDELDDYGAVDNSAKLKDLIEISKNSGTYGTPVYATDGSRKVTLEEFSSMLGANFLTGVTTIQVLDGASTALDRYDTHIIDLVDRGKLLIFEVVDHRFSDSFECAFHLELPVAPPDGFAFFAQFDCIGASTNNFDEYRFSSGNTYLIVYDATNAVWNYSYFKNHTNGYAQHITTGQGVLEVSEKQVYNTGVFYIKQSTYFGVDQTKSLKIILPPLLYNVGAKCTFVLDYDLLSSALIEFQAYNDGVMIDEIRNVTTTYKLPFLCKKGTTLEFTAYYAPYTDSFEKSNFWMLTNEIIRL